MVVSTCDNTYLCPNRRPRKIETTIATHNTLKYAKKPGSTINASKMNWLIGVPPTRTRLQLNATSGEQERRTAGEMMTIPVALTSAIAMPSRSRKRNFSFNKKCATVTFDSTETQPRGAIRDAGAKEKALKLPISPQAIIMIPSLLGAMLQPISNKKRAFVPPIGTSYVRRSCSFSCDAIMGISTAKLALN